MLAASLIWFLVVAAVVVLLIRLLPSTRPSGTPPVAGRGGPPESQGLPGLQRETAAEILDRRFASGEIDAETYRAQRAVLAEARPAPGG